MKFSQWSSSTLTGDRFRSPKKFLHISATLKNKPEKETVIPRVDTTPVRKPQYYRLIAGWLGFIGPAPPEKEKTRSLDYQSFHASTTATNQ